MEKITLWGRFDGKITGTQEQVKNFLTKGCTKGIEFDVQHHGYVPAPANEEELIAMGFGPEDDYEF